MRVSIGLGVVRGVRVNCIGNSYTPLAIALSLSCESAVMSRR